jgi:hypothetical protein
MIGIRYLERLTKRGQAPSSQVDREVRRMHSSEPVPFC